MLYWVAVCFPLLSWQHRVGNTALLHANSPKQKQVNVYIALAFANTAQAQSQTPWHAPDSGWVGGWRVAVT